MREIKFRFWDGTEGNKAMCYQNEYGQFKYPTSGFILGFHQAWKEANETEGYNKPKALMQYTGMKDKHSVEIYEGDLLAYPDKDGKYTRSFQCNWGETSCGCCATIIGYDTDFEGMSIIGNIYEHPELLRDIS